MPGRHRMGPRTRAGRGRRATVVAVALAASLVAATAGAYAYERSSEGTLPPGVRIAGVDVGGLDRAGALVAVGPRAEAIEGRVVVLRAGARSWTVAARDLGVVVDPAAAVDRAFADAQALGWPALAYHRIARAEVSVRVEIPVVVDETALSAAVRRLARQVVRPARDARVTYDFDANRLVRTPARPGVRLLGADAERAIRAGLAAGDPVIDLPVATTAPRVGDDALGKTIVVDISENRLFLYDGLRRAKTYRVATGQPAYPTPVGSFEIITKEVNPTWVNPARDTWGATEPAEIPPGPGNPLGTRALALSAPGILIHGTPDDWSIGTHASHGCIRMHMWDVEELFPLVYVGTPVFLVP